jgi:S-formylglutathione hydrolase FrmB
LSARASRTLAALAVLAVVAAAAALAGANAIRVDRHGAAVTDFTVRSRLLHRTVTETQVVPTQAAKTGAPLLLLLHGRGGDPHSLESRGLFDGLYALGTRAPVVVLVNGADHSYYHDRASGRWGSYVVREVLPAAIRRLHADPRRVAIGGISMGGFGALDLARLNPGRFCAAGGHSAAIFFSGATSAPGAFDDAADFARHDLLALARRRGRVGLFGPKTKVWLDSGLSDPFRPALRRLAAALHVPLHGAPGGHEGSYWSAHMPMYLRFYARALARC